MSTRWVTALVAGLLLLACARHVVVSADRAAQLNDTEWHVQSAPGGADAGAR